MEKSEIITWVSKKDNIGFRGSYFSNKNPKWPKLARLQVIVEKPKPEIILPDIPAECLPYLPDESEGSEFQKNGHWHYFEGIMEIDEDATTHNIVAVRLDGKQIYNGYLINL